MADTHETIADIIAEIRALSNPISDGIIAIIGMSIADRFEAAHKRERGNAAKLREALCEILSYIETFHKYITPDKGEGLTALFAVADTIRSKARAALSAPPRNCDVGTAEEQAFRFADFCDSWKVVDDMTECDKCNGDCPLIGAEGECKFAWAQMPYDEEGGAK